MARDSLLSFNKAVQEKSFDTFYKQELASIFREQMTLEKFTAAFQSFFGKGYDISDIAKSEPVFDDPPAIDSDGMLALKGVYPTRPTNFQEDFS